MRHVASRAFWQAYDKLPAGTRRAADTSFALVKQNPEHPSLHLKRIGKFWSVRIGLRYRALAVEIDGGLLWFWIGSHADYDARVR